MKKEDRSDLSQRFRRQRKELDLIDHRLLTLLNHRFRIAFKIGKKIYDPRREEEILKRLKLKNRGPLKDEDLIKIFTTIMRVCRRSQL